MSYSPMNKTGDGSTKDYTIEFDYLRRAFVHVTIDDTEITAFSISSSGVLSFDTAPASGAVIIIYRETPTTRLVSWADASVLKAKDMTIQQVQDLHVIEEEKVWIQENSVLLNDEDEWDMRNHRVINVAQPVDDNDAVTKIYVDNEEKSFSATIKDIISFASNIFDDKLTIAKDAASSASASQKDAATSASNAKTSETNAKESETNAKNYMGNASTSATNAKVSETNAKTSETNAKTSETNASSSQKAAATSEANAKKSETVANEDVAILDEFIDNFVSLSVAPPVDVLDSAHIMVTPTINII